MNFIPAELRSNADNDTIVALPGGKALTLTTRGGAASTQSDIEIGIRPEHIKLGQPDDPAANLVGNVEIVERLGNATIMYVETPAGQIVVQDPGDVATKVGDNVSVILNPSSVHIFSAEVSR
jgi:multiple sugar transport system ATP-binding protein